MSDTTHVLAQLMATIEARRDRPPDPTAAKKSYTVKLLEGGTAKIGSKITEEAAEVVEAAGEPDEAGRAHFVYECADLVYHLFVMMAHRGVKIAELEAELARRFGMSGLEEKASRKQAE